MRLLLTEEEQIALRDWFAGMALQGILACFRDFRNADDGPARARLAYEYADLMMKERDKARQH